MNAALVAFSNWKVSAPYQSPQSKNTVSTFQITCRVLSFVLEISWSDEQTIDPLQSTLPNIYTYNILLWKWIDEKFEIKWMYLLCFMFVDTAFLLCEAVLQHLTRTRLFLRARIHIPIWPPYIPLSLARDAIQLDNRTCFIRILLLPTFYNKLFVNTFDKASWFCIT